MAGSCTCGHARLSGGTAIQLSALDWHRHRRRDVHLDAQYPDPSPPYTLDLWKYVLALPTWLVDQLMVSAVHRSSISYPICNRPLRLRCDLPKQCSGYSPLLHLLSSRSEVCRSAMPGRDGRRSPGGVNRGRKSGNSWTSSIWMWLGLRFGLGLGSAERGAVPSNYLSTYLPPVS